jgi:hypothetical protein
MVLKIKNKEIKKMTDKGFTGELNRFAGDAAKQRAMEFAKQKSAVVMFSNDFKYKGVNNCFIVVDSMENFAKASVNADEQSTEPINIVADFTGKK